MDEGNFSDYSLLLKNGFGSNKRNYDDNNVVEETISISEANVETKELSTKIPVDDFAILKQHRKGVSTIDLDRSGARLISGSHDYSLAYYDFAGMDSTLSPFRVVSINDGSPIRFARFSGSGEYVLVGAGTSLRLLDRHGKVIQDYPKGDPYLMDMKKTIGHVGNIMCGAWNRLERDDFITGGQDGTIRCWNVKAGKVCKGILVVRSGQPGKKNPVILQAKYTVDGKRIVCGCSDGGIRIYDVKGPWIKPLIEVKSAHQAEISSIALSPDGTMLASRGLDDSLKLWNLAKMNEPIATVNNLSNIHEQTECIFSPDGSVIVTGTSARKEKGSEASQKGLLHFFNVNSMTETVKSIPVNDSSVISLAWHPILNQIYVGSGDGSVTAFFDPFSLDKKGILRALSKAPAASSTEAVIDNSNHEIHTPNALPLFRKPGTAKGKRQKVKANDLQKHIPEKPVNGPGVGGRLGSSVTQGIMKNVIRDSSRDQDPREALLKYAEIAKNDPKFIAPAYALTQPKLILDEKLLEKEVEAEEKRKKADEITARFTRKISNNKE